MEPLTGNSKSVMVILILSILSLCGCSERSNDSSEVTQSNDNSELQGEGASEDVVHHDLNTLYKIRPGAGIGPVEFGMSGKEIIKYFGDPKEIKNEGLSYLYPSKGITFMVTPKKGMVIINCYTRKSAPPFLSVRDFKGMTEEGIKMGSSSSEIISAYGQPDKKSSTGAQINLEYSELKIRFILLNDRLVQFDMRAL